MKESNDLNWLNMFDFCWTVEIQSELVGGSTYCWTGSHKVQQGGHFDVISLRINAGYFGHHGAHVTSL